MSINFRGPMVDLSPKILFHDQLRFLLTTPGVDFSVMLVLVQVGLFQGLIRYAADTIPSILKRRPFG
ncbi:MAG: hypothetical protein ACYCYP_13245 [Leptospirales bacterium]